MTYRELIAEHDAIEASALVVVTLAEGGFTAATEAAKALEILAQLLRDHLAGEDATMYQTILAARGSRHADTAQRMGLEFDALKDDWAEYLYRWDATRIASNWPAFASDTKEILGRIRERVAFETMILYSLALHLDIITVD